MLHVESLQQGYEGDDNDGMGVEIIGGINPAMANKHMKAIERRC